MVADGTGHKGIALIYCRVSTKHQELEGTSLDSQEQRCADKAAELGYEVGRVTREVYTGAELWDRPQLSRDRADLKAGKFQALIAYDHDRLSRDPIHFGIIVQECARAGVELVLVNAPLDTSPEGMLIQYVKGYAAAMEREKFKERSLRGRLTRVQSGKLPNSAVELYGYRRDKGAGVRTPYEPEASVIRMVFDWVAQGVPIREVARRLNDRGIPPPGNGKVTYSIDPDRVRKWANGTIHRLLTRTDYKGETFYWRWHGPAGSPQNQRPRDEWVRLPDEASPAIVSEEVWDAVQHRLAHNRGDWARNQTRPYLLRGLVSCAICGRLMHVRHQHKNYVAYVCSSSYCGDRVSCGASQVHLTMLEAWAWEEIARILKDPRIIAAELERRRDEGPDPLLTSDLEATKRELTKIKKQQERLIRQFGEAEDDTFPWELLQQQISRLEQDKERLADVITDLERRLSEQRLAIDQLEALTAYCDRVGHNLEAFTLEDKRLAVEALGVRVLANGREWELRGSIPLGESAVVSSHTHWHASRRTRRSWCNCRAETCSRRPTSSACASADCSAVSPSGAGWS